VVGSNLEINSIASFFGLASQQSLNKEGLEFTVTNLRRYFLWCALYLALILAFGQADYFGRPIINFASFFYLVAMIGVPATLFFPFATRVSTFVPLTIWAGIYAILSFLINRDHTSTNDISIILLEFMLLEVGIWLAHQLALHIGHTESVMDELAVNVFPNRAQEIDEANQRVKIELSRSRRYHRPLSLLLIEVDPDIQGAHGVASKSIQYDIVNRFTSARVGQIIDDRIRQTDLVLRDRKWSYVILCPETDRSAVLLLANRMTETIREKTGQSVSWGVAAFPEEAVTFEDLMMTARQRLTQGGFFEDTGKTENVEKEILKA
jgi:hypothetical protein